MEIGLFSTRPTTLSSLDGRTESFDLTVLIARAMCLQMPLKCLKLILMTTEVLNYRPAILWRERVTKNSSNSRRELLTNPEKPKRWKTRKLSSGPRSASTRTSCPSTPKKGVKT
ncbi:unnamed protein product [Victoria cruziana]